jgi:3-phenylpropionate/cinnamic acid dioxygenase small subunit
MEMQQMAAIGSRPLGEDRDIFPLRQNFGDFLINDSRMAATATTKKNGIVSGSQPSQQRPISYLFLGDKGSWQHRVDNIDINPRHMIGNQHRARHNVRQIRLNLDAQRIE